ncbi:VOC family protein [Cohnella sp.]|uniref:VOC family protein n=1 Tax=Cohnella sp. TaxID=1883426 RepID=UPI003567E5B7
MIERIDHIVLTVRDLEKTVRFYTGALGMELITFGANRKALSFGQQKINLHEYGNEFEPKAQSPLPGSEDLCFITKEPIEELRTQFIEKGIDIVEGPVKRTGALGPITSIYFRDPDGNLIELSNY